MQNKTNCPLCSSESKNKPAFPFYTKYLGQHFNFHSCCQCNTAFICPLPTEYILNSIYSGSSYHVNNYSDKSSQYQESLDFFVKCIKDYDFKMKLLDYGCGVGYFINEANERGFNAEGVEFSADAVLIAHQETHVNIMTVNDLDNEKKMQYDVVHLGDVLEHLTNPILCITELLSFLKIGGYLYVEGPLERNFSFVNYMVMEFGLIKYRLGLTRSNSFSPTHLFRTDSRAQFNFFKKNFRNLYEIKYEVYETGWPYSEHTGLRFLISKISTMISFLIPLKFNYGNRFRIILKKTM